MAALGGEGGEEIEEEEEMKKDDEVVSFLGGIEMRERKEREE